MASIGFLPSASVTQVRIRSSVSAEVVSDGMSSTSCITGAGLKKCTPMTWCGAARDGAELDDRDRRGVGREDRVVLGQDLADASEQVELGVLDLGCRFDHEVAVGQLLEVVGERDARQHGLDVGGLDLAPLLGPPSELSTRSAAALAASLLISTTTTSSPARAATSVMPDPMSPPPMTPTLSILRMYCPLLEPEVILAFASRVRVRVAPRSGRSAVVR